MKNAIFWQAHPRALALSTTVGIVYVLCVLALLAIPNASMRLFNSWFHGIDLSRIATTTLLTGETLFGLITLLVFTYLAGLVYGFIYHKCIEHCRAKGWSSSCCQSKKQ